MVEQLQLFWEFIKPNLSNFIVEGVIMVSAIIAFMGILKKYFFDKIQNKTIRKIFLSLTSLIFAFVGTAIKFLVEGKNAEHYLYMAIPIAISTIVVYWFYESFGIRQGVHKLGNLTLNKVWTMLLNILKKVFSGKKVNVANEVLAGLDTVKKSVITEIPNYITHDRDVENL
jgi:hypothetical protein